MESNHSETPNQVQKNWSIGLIMLLALGGGVGLWQFLSISQAPPALSTSQEPPPKSVETGILSHETGIKKIKLLGQVETSEQATIRSQVDGIVQKILVKVGDRITPGMTVAILDDADAQVALSEARANLIEEQSNLERLQIGTRAEIIAQKEAELKTAKAKEQEAQENLQSLIALKPTLMAQKEAEVAIAKARQKEAEDNFKRIKELQDQGAISERILVEAKTTAKTAYSEYLGAQAALSTENTQRKQAIAQAKTAVDAAISERLRVAAMLTEAKAGPTPEEIAAQSGVVKASQALVAQAQLRLKRAEIKTDSSGVVESRLISDGDYVESGDEIITIVNNDRLDIFLEVPEQLSGQIQSGTKVTLTARALPNWKQTAEVIGVVPAADSNSRRQLVRVNLTNPPQGLLPGMAIQGDVELPLISQGNDFIIPRDALTRRGDQWLVFTVQGDKAQEHNVEMLADLGEKVAIRNSQLTMGQKIVISGGDGLKDGVKVRDISIGQ